MRLGILGGSFNPIHIGHLILAECAREQFRLDRVWFIPTARPPHKSAEGLLPGPMRLAMVRLALRGHPTFRASDLELKLGGISYTLRTVQRLRTRYPRARLFLIIGSDMLQVHWYRWQHLRKMCTILAAPRAEATPAGGAHLQRIAMPEIAISSSLVRTRLRRRQSIRYLVPDAVAGYIAQRGLYRRGSSEG